MYSLFIIIIFFLPSVSIPEGGLKIDENDWGVWCSVRAVIIIIIISVINALIQAHLT